MKTVAELAQDVANAYDIDTETAQQVVQVHVDQISDDPDLWNAADQTLTNNGAQVVSRAIQHSTDHQLWGTQATAMLDELAEVTNRLSQHDELIADRDRLIRNLMGTEVPREHIASVAGLKVARLYQIRDGRR